MRDYVCKIAFITGLLAFWLDPLTGFSATEPPPTVSIITSLPRNANRTKAYIIKDDDKEFSTGFKTRVRDEPTARAECKIEKTYLWELLPKDDIMRLYPTDEQATDLTVAAQPLRRDYVLSVTVKWIETATGPEGHPRGEISCSDSLTLSPPRVNLKEVEFSSIDAGYHDVCKDQGGATYAKPHWQDNSTPLDRDVLDENDHDSPVCFDTTSRMAVRAKFQLSSVVNPVPATVVVKGDGSGDFDFPSQTVPVVEGVAEYPATGAETPAGSARSFGNAVHCYPYGTGPFKIAWRVSFDGGTTFDDAGESANEIFVKRKRPDAAHPQARKLWRTLLCLACKNVGGITDDQCFDNVWKSFSIQDKAPANPKGWDAATKAYAKPLYFYKEGSKWGEQSGQGQAGPLNCIQAFFDQPVSTAGCFEWAWLLQQALHVHGVAHRGFAEVYPALEAQIPLGLLVKNWSFGPPTANPPEAPFADFKYTIAVNVDANGNFEMVQAHNQYGDLKSEKGLPGQNSETPSQKIFARHLLLVYLKADRVGRFYDPSYGLVTQDPGTIAGLANTIEVKMISGYIGFTMGPNQYRAAKAPATTKLMVRPWPPRRP